MNNLTPQDLAQAHENVKTLTDVTDNVCGSTSLPEYRSHLDALGELHDQIATLRNLCIREKNEWANHEREMKRLLDKLDDHRVRTKAGYNDLRFNPPAKASVVLVDQEKEYATAEDAALKAA